MAGGEIKKRAKASARARARESARDFRERLFEDPVAAAFLDTKDKLRNRLSTWPLMGPALERWDEWRVPGALGLLLARTCYLDEVVRDGVAGGVAQVVVLGAGCDTRAFRTPGIEKARVFEIDEPAIQAWKRARLEARFTRLPDHVSLVPLDLESGSLEHALRDAGFLSGVPTLWLWESGTECVTADTLDRTLAVVRAVSAPASRIAFTFVDRRAIEGTRPFGGPNPTRTAATRAGRPWIFGLLPGEVGAFLESRGFDLVEHVGAAELKTRYQAPRGRESEISTHERVVVAESYRAER